MRISDWSSDGCSSDLSADPHPVVDVNSGAVLLMYHRFGEDDLPSTSIRLSQFEAHLAELTSGRYRVMALPEIVARLRAGQPLPQRAVAITIDDAALSVYREENGRASWRERGWKSGVSQVVAVSVTKK